MSEQPTDTKRARAPRLSRGSLAAVYLAILLAVSLFLDFRDGGYVPEVWLAAALLVAFLVLTMAALAPLPPIATRGAAVVLALLLAYIVWMALSGAWALSLHRTWLEVARGLFFVLVFGLALLFVGDQSRRWPGLLLLGTAAVLTVMPVIRLALAPDVSDLFIQGRFYYPISYPNGAAALYLIPFWPLLALAADGGRALVWRAASLALASMLPALALMTQSRGALYAFILTAFLLLMIAPLRLRALLYLITPVALTAWSFDAFNRYWVEGPEQVAGSPAASRLLLLGLAGAAAAVVFSQLERIVRLSPRRRLVAGAALGMLLAGVLLFGGDRVPSPGEVSEQVRTAWAVFSESADERPGSDESRFLTFSSSGRWDLWRVAWQDFREEPLKGVGVGSYLYTHERLRSQERPVQEAHSLQLGALAESGIVGFALLTAFSAAAVIFALRHRLRLRLTEEERSRLLGVTLTLMGFVYWLIHAAVDWLWHIPGLSILALILLAVALNEGAKIPAGRDHQTAESAAAAGRRPQVIRAAAVILAGITLLAAGLPYLSLRYQQIAVANLGTQPAVGETLTGSPGDGQGTLNVQKALQAAVRAGRLAPYDPEPLVIRSLAYRSWALSAGDDRDRRLLGLALALGAQEEGIEVVPADWRGHYRAAQAALELADAVENAPEIGAGVAAAQRTLDNATASAAELPGITEAQLAKARGLVSRSPADLRSTAEDHLEEARLRNPLYERLASLSSGVSGATP